MDVVISSPPYATLGLEGGDPEARMRRLQKALKAGTLGKGGARLAVRGKFSVHTQEMMTTYGVTEGQLGGMKEGDVIDVVLSSPPYGDQNDHERPLDRTRTKSRDSICKPYGTDSHNLGNMKTKGGPPMTTKTKARKIVQDQWFHCFDGNWKGYIVEEATSHPAKFARGLITRIVSYLLERKYVKKGDVVCDPFGGICTAGLVCAYKGLQWVGVELEPRFVKLGNENIAKHRGKYLALKLPVPLLLKGDSRNLCDILATHADSVLTSPPYAATVKGKHEQKETAKESAKKRKMEGGSLGQSQRHHGHGNTNDNLGNLAESSVDTIVSSPPFTGVSGAEAKPESYKGFEHVGSVKNKKNDTKAGYGSTDGQLGVMSEGAVDVIVSGVGDKPQGGGGINVDRGGKNKKKVVKIGKTDGNPEARPNSPGNIDYMERDDVNKVVRRGDKKEGETFWSAAKEIVLQCYQILKVGGIAVFNCKDFVRNKKRVLFSDDWVKLCEHCGFELIEHHYAMLKMTSKRTTLFGDEEIKKKEKKSFFKKLAEKKGSPNIDWEDVLIFRKVGPVRRTGVSLTR